MTTPGPKRRVRTTAVTRRTGPELPGGACTSDGRNIVDGRPHIVRRRNDSEDGDGGASRCFCGIEERQTGGLSPGGRRCHPDRRPNI
mmetsp:Transcript_20892/g.32320  ORF Transcript_20892/g.32320 Transcript_20892/m.32320 type:complete len:87 (+) Transcript_20892:327-587(+)